MAASTREDRALMRVRGAGSRKVPTVNFGFDFAFGNGKQTRPQVPTPARSLRSNTKTPQSRSSTSRQVSRTPARRSREASAARSIRHISTQPGSTSNVQHVQENATSEENMRSAKRRRTTPDVVTPNTSLSTTNARPAPSTRASRRRTASKIFTIAEDQDSPEPLRAVPSDEGRHTSPLFVPQDEQQKENDTPKETGSKTTHETDLQTTKSGRILLDPTTFPGDNTEQEPEVPESENEETLPSVLETPSILVAAAAGASKQNKRRKRKSVTLSRKRRRSSTPGHSTTTPRDNSVAIPSSRAASVEQSSLPVVPLADRISRYSKLARTKKARPRGTTPEHEDTPKAGEDGDDSYVEDTEPEPETPAVSRKASRQNRKRQPRSQSVEASKSKKGKATFPILTHRLNHVSTLATIHEDDEDGTPFGDAYANTTERSQPNVVDVLAQICRETISNLIERINAGEPAQKAAAKNKRTALEAFRKDLDNELFSMSEAVENRTNLEARVRKSKREKTGLQTEYLEVRKEREQIALKCDAVRRQHWECEEETRQKWTLSEAARRTEQQLELNEADEDDGLEFLLRIVTDTVSSASGHGGILDKVKAFNAQLQSMALLLEGRVL
ncbi:hypothetical protein H2200_013019 [Cladophialophora chaetospira]|uniref:Inner kinetochore subunit AME1 domain-containing protein n=1 Tax=Cladophialophora chaetospira TaxID=386627 RepID=A0AA38WWL1_9EURO|nr:hypothetical protein H2200_013019 [Cladophialophora chaetospira]